MPALANGIFTQQDFLQIANTLYESRTEEMIARQVFKDNTSYAPYAQEIGYDYYTRTGSAKILAYGGSATDIPFVGEKGGRNTQKVYDIVSGIRFMKKEQEAMAAKRALGKGPAVQLDTQRVASARRFIYETENKIAFVGDTAHSIKGVFDASFYGANLGTKENVAQGAVGGTAAEKRLWSNKTPKEILADLLIAKTAIEKDGLFQARTIVLSPAAKLRLAQPYSDQNPMTLMSWLNSEGMYFQNWLTSRVMKTTNNGDTVDYFMVLDNDPEIVELCTTRQLFLENPVFDLVGTMEQAAMLSTGGVMVRHPAGFYIGKGI